MRKQPGAMLPFTALEGLEGHVPGPSSQPLSCGASHGLASAEFQRLGPSASLNPHLLCVSSHRFWGRGVHTGSPRPPSG